MHECGSVLNAAVEEIHVSEKVVDEGSRRPMVDLVGRSDLLDAPLVENSNAVGQLERFILIVSDEDAGDMHSVVEFAEPAAQFEAHFGIERSKRLIKQQNAGFDRQRTGKSNTLALPSRELGRIPMRLIFELNQPKQIIHFLTDFFTRWTGAPRANSKTESDVFEDGHMAEEREVLKNKTDAAIAGAAGGNVMAIEFHRAGIGELESRNDAQQGGLAGAGGPEKRDQLARRNLQIDLVKR